MFHPYYGGETERLNVVLERNGVKRYTLLNVRKWVKDGVEGVFHPYLRERSWAAI